MYTRFSHFEFLRENETVRETVLACSCWAQVGGFEKKINLVTLYVIFQYQYKESLNLLIFYRVKQTKKTFKNYNCTHRASLLTCGIKAVQKSALKSGPTFSWMRRFLRFILYHACKMAIMNIIHTQISVISLSGIIYLYLFPPPPSTNFVSALCDICYGHKFFICSKYFYSIFLGELLSIMKYFYIKD